MSRTLVAMAVGLLIVLAGWPGCQFTPLTGVPGPVGPTSQPEALAASTRPDVPVGHAGPRIGLPLEPSPADGSPGQVIQLTPPPVASTTQRDSGPTSWPGAPAIAIGLPAGVRAEHVMPGPGRPPLAGDDAARKRAAMQAALFVAVYNVTHEINPESYRDEIEKGYVLTDHFIYRDGAKDGLQVKSRTVVIEGKVTQFDVWLVVPPSRQSSSPGQDGFQVQVRNFRLVGDALDAAKLARVLASAGGHLAVSQMVGPDDHGGYTVEVALVRKAK